MSIKSVIWLLKLVCFLSENEMIINLFTTFISAFSNFNFLIFRIFVAIFGKTTRHVILIQTWKRRYGHCFHLQKFALILGLGLLDCLHGHLTFAQGTSRVIFEPILDAIVMEIVLQLARQGQNVLFGLKFAKTYAALVGELRQRLRSPLNFEQLV